MSHPVKISNRSITRKIIIAFLLAVVTIVCSIAISNTSFRKVLGRVDQLAAPNPRLQLVNQLFRDIVMLDQDQRTQALNKKGTGYGSLIRASAQVQLLLDSLKQMSAGDTSAILRVDSMKNILKRHDRLLLDYLKLSRNLDHIDTLQEQVRTLAQMIERANDSARVSTENRIVTTIEQIPDSSQFKQERQSLWDRIFAKRKTPEVQKAQRLIRQFYDVKVDTMGMEHDSNVHQLTTAIAHAEQDRMTQRNTLLRQQVKLSAAGNTLVAQTLSILRELEQKEMAQAHAGSSAARAIVGKSIFNINLVLIIFIAGTGILLYIILADVARSNVYRQQLLEAKEEAEQLGSVKQRFLANMSHELRTPLQIIIGATEQMNDPRQVSAEKLNTVHKASQHLLQIVNEVLDYSRIVSGKFKIEQAPFNMAETLEEVCSVIAVQAEHKHIRFVYEADIRTDVMYSGDAFRLKQVLYNLLGNAVKFTQQGSVTLKVQQRAVGRHAVFRFIVQDTGPGIKAEELDQIFDLFEQGGQAGAAAKGSGLGLNIAKLLIEEQQGTIKVDSEWGKGASFEVNIPYSYASPDLGPAGEFRLPGVPHFSGQIWVVDDDPFILRLCGELLDKHKLNNSLFRSAEEVLKALPAPDLKLLFLDIRLPGMDGTDLCRLLRRQLGDTLRIVALTAQAMPDERQSIMEAGFDRLLTKPFREKELIALIAGYEEEEPAETSPDDSETPDLQRLEKMVGAALLPQVLGQLLAETEEDLRLSLDCVAEHDFATAANYLHRMAGRLAQAGATAAAAGCRGMEQSFRSGHHDKDAFIRIAARVRAALQYIRHYLEAV